MANVPRPLTAISVIMARPGPKASKVTMRRSRAKIPGPSWGGGKGGGGGGDAPFVDACAKLLDPHPQPLPTMGRGVGQTSAEAIKNDGSKKKIWLATNAAGCRTWSYQPRTSAARCSA